MTPEETREKAIKGYWESGQRLAARVDTLWSDLLGMGPPGTEHWAINELQRFVDDYRDACSEFDRTTQQINRAGWKP